MSPVAESTDVQGLLSDLYRGPLEEFVARRTRLVRETRSRDASTAVAIGKARKPPVSVWAIDQLAADKQNVLAELLAAAADASAAQRVVADQSETRESLLLATGRLREAVESAARAADAVLDGVGNAATDDTRRRIRSTLQAAATGSPDERLLLWRGTLDHEIAPSGFGTVAAAQDDPPELAVVLAPLRHLTTVKKPRPRVLSSELDTREREERAARENAERTADKVSAASDRARDLAKAKRRHAEALADELRTAEDEAAAAERAADDAEDAAKAARSALRG
jgi:hypothetical protein